MITIVFEPHATTVDNEKKIVSGWFDAELSERGITQAQELGRRRADEHYSAVFCSDTQRAVNTAKLAFGNRFPIISDARLRECDYGDFEHRPSQEAVPEKLRRIDVPFPNGESYAQVTRRIGEFLRDLARDYVEGRVFMVGHGATHMGLDVWLNGLTIEQSLRAIDANGWQPGWEYQLDDRFISRFDEFTAAN